MIDLTARSALAIPIVACCLAACGHRANEDPVPDRQGETADVDAAPADSMGFTVDMVEDWEDGDREIKHVGGRYGHWYNYDDGSIGANNVAVVALDPTTERHATYLSTSTMALRVDASGYDNWGSGYSADVAAGGPYDVSAYTGLVLWMKNLSGHPSSVHVSILDANSDPRGGICDKSPEASTGAACYDALGQSLDLTDSWQMYLLPFRSLRQIGYGLPEPSGLDTARIYNIAFSDGGGGTFAYYLDDIGFYRE